VPPETTGGIRLEASIVGQKRVLTLRVGARAVNRFVAVIRPKRGRYLLPFGTVTVTFFVLAFPDASVAWTVTV
jgi:hypothetical protein